MNSDMHGSVTRVNESLHKTLIVIKKLRGANINILVNCS